MLRFLRETSWGCDFGLKRNEGWNCYYSEWPNLNLGQPRERTQNKKKTQNTHLPWLLRPRGEEGEFSVCFGVSETVVREGRDWEWRDWNRAQETRLKFCFFPFAKTVTGVGIWLWFRFHPSLCCTILVWLFSVKPWMAAVCVRIVYNHVCFVADLQTETQVFRDKFRFGVMACSTGFEVVFRFLNCIVAVTCFLLALLVWYRN